MAAAVLGKPQIHARYRQDAGPGEGSTSVEVKLVLASVWGLKPCTLS